MGRNISQSVVASSTEPNPTGIFGQGNIRVFYDSGTFTTPSYARAIKVRVWGAGGSGGFLGSSSYAQGGAGGGYSEKIIVNPSASYAVTVGAGGAARANSGTNQAGVAGGTSSFGSECSATGGGGGASATSTSGATGGSGSGGDFNYTGGASGSTDGNDNLTTGGGSAAGPWGNGYASGSISGGGTVRATGGAGIGGSSGSISNSTTNMSTAGGGSLGPSRGIANSNHTTWFGSPGGIGASGYTPMPVRYTAAQAGSINFWHLGNDGVSDSDIAQKIRFPGDMLPAAGGAGGASVYRNTGVAIFAGNGGYGAGGSATVPSGFSDPNYAGNGGLFGGGGAAGVQIGAGYNGTAGSGGIAAGGGAGGGSSNASGAGGNGLVVVEW